MTLFIFASTATCSLKMHIIDITYIINIISIFKGLRCGNIQYFEYYFCLFLYKIFVECAQIAHKMRTLLAYTSILLTYFSLHINCITYSSNNQTKTLLWLLTFYFFRLCVDKMWTNSSFHNIFCFHKYYTKKKL